MKNPFLLVCALLILSLGVNAQTKSKRPSVKSSTPEVIKTSFKAQYPNVETVKWTKTLNGNYTAVFTNAEGREQTTEYNAEGAVLKSKIVFPIEGIEESMTTAVQSQYADATITSFTRYELAGMPAYYKIKIQAPDQSPKEILMSEEGAITE